MLPCKQDDAAVVYFCQDAENYEIISLIIEGGREKYCGGKCAVDKIFGTVVLRSLCRLYDVPDPKDMGCYSVVEVPASILREIVDEEIDDLPMNLESHVVVFDPAAVDAVSTPGPSQKKARATEVDTLGNEAESEINAPQAKFETELESIKKQQDADRAAAQKAKEIQLAEVQQEAEDLRKALEDSRRQLQLSRQLSKGAPDSEKTDEAKMANSGEVQTAKNADKVLLAEMQQEAEDLRVALKESRQQLLESGYQVAGTPDSPPVKQIDGSGSDKSISPEVCWAKEEKVEAKFRKAIVVNVNGVVYGDEELSAPEAFEKFAMKAGTLRDYLSKDLADGPVIEFIPDKEVILLVFETPDDREEFVNLFDLKNIKDDAQKVRFIKYFYKLSRVSWDTSKELLSSGTMTISTTAHLTML